MPTYVSKDGTWHPGKEHAVLPHLAGTDKEVYDGPDRAAMFELFQAKQATLGQDFRHDPELLMRIRALGYQTIEEYCQAVGYDAEKAKKDFEEKASVVTMHELPKRVKEAEFQSGGTEQGTGKVIRKGGFGTAPDL